MPPLARHVAQLQADLPYPWQVDFDEVTDNLIVNVDGVNGFVISHQALEEFKVPELVAMSLSAKLRPLAEIKREGLGKTEFDKERSVVA